MKSKNNKRTIKDRRQYTLEVFIISGPVTKKFSKKNLAISRTIQIRGDQTLEDLHETIFDAFNRYDEHMYEFQMDGNGPMDPEAKKYTLPMAMEGPFGDDQAGDVTRTNIGSLELKVNESFGYWFDFGDDWWHQINVVAIDNESSGKYPRIVKRRGESPPQYPHIEE